MCKMVPFNHILSERPINCIQQHLISLKMKQEKYMFHGHSFAILSNAIDEQQTQTLQDIIVQQSGNAQIITIPLKSKKTINVDYLLAQPSQCPSEIRQLLPKNVKYKEPPIDFHFVYKCLSENKFLSIKKFELKSAEGIDTNRSGKKRVKKSQEESEGTEKMDDQNQQKQEKKKDITAPSMNKYIIDQMQKLLKVYSNEGDKGRKIAYSRAITALKSYGKEIKNDDDLDELARNQKHIGPKLIDKMKQLLKTGSIQKLQILKNTDKNLAADELTRVWGVGSVKAKQLYGRGIKSIEELRAAVQKNPEILTKNQKIGLKYLEDLQIRIPRQKVGEMFEFIREIFFQLTGSNHSHEIEVCGSYRRGKQTCGDMDVFITRKDGVFQKNLLTEFVNLLQKKGFLTDHLTMPRHTDTNCQSYMGVARFKSDVHHRIDIKYYPVDQFAYAVLYFTGSDMFNRKMRLQAMEKGYHLSDHGMHKAIKDGAKVTATGPNIPCKTEKQIFNILGIVYKEPHQRSI